MLKDGPGWYRGDLHTHTHFSDGDLSPAELLQTARREGLDFFAITDHNSVDAYPEFGETADPLVIPGVEVTLHQGHFNVFGLASGGDWQAAICTGQPIVPLPEHLSTTSALMAHTAAADLINSLNHPFLEPWQWYDRELELHHLTCLEIWNDPSWPDNVTANPQALALWTRLLNAGHRITAVGGSDYHRPQPRPGEVKPPERLGLPGTYVYAESLSVAAVLQALRRHRVYVSMAPQLTFQAEASGHYWGIGDDIGAFDGPVTFGAVINNCPQPARLQLLRNGRVAREEIVDSDSYQFQYRATLCPDESAWFRLDLLQADSDLIWAVTNPIFTGPQPPRQAVAW
jgi:hypothetical protein